MIYDSSCSTVEIVSSANEKSRVVEIKILSPEGIVVAQKQVQISNTPTILDVKGLGPTICISEA